MEASTIGIDAEAEGNVGAVVAGDDAAGAIEEVLRPRVAQGAQIVLVETVEVDVAPEAREAVGQLDV
jgi:hypothetical protein